MVTILFIASLLWATKKSNNKEKRDLAILCTFITALVIVVLGAAYGVVLTTTPADLETADQKVQSIEKQMDDLTSNFIDSLNGSNDESQKTKAYAEEYNVLSKELEEAKLKKQRIEEMLNPDSFWSHTLPKILLDFGITEKIIGAMK